jgi:hypothetical protein
LLVLKIPDAVGGFVGTGDEQVEIAIAICVAWNRPSPKSDAEIDGQTRVVVRQGLQLLRAGHSKTETESA